MDGIDAARERPGGAFGELHADAGGIDATAVNIGEREEGPENIFDFVERPVLEFNAAAVPHDIADFFAEIDDAEVMFARDIHADIEGVSLGFTVLEGSEEFLQRRHAAGGFAGIEEFIGEEGGGFIGGLAAVFLLPLFLVEAFGAKPGDEVFTGVLGLVELIDAFDEALLDRIVEGDPVMTPAHAITADFDVGNDFIEDGAKAAMRGEDGEGAAPGGARFGEAIEEALVLMDGELIQFDMTGLANERVRAGGEAVDGAAIGEAQDVGGERFLLVDELIAVMAGGLMEGLGPMLGVLNVLEGGEFVAGRDPNDGGAPVSRGFDDGVVGIDIGHADLAGLLDNSEAAGVAEPADLVREEMFFVSGTTSGYE